MHTLVSGQRNFEHKYRKGFNLTEILNEKARGNWGYKVHTARGGDISGSLVFITLTEEAV